MQERKSHNKDFSPVKNPLRESREKVFDKKSNNKTLTSCKSAKVLQVRDVKVKDMLEKCRINSEGIVPNIADIKRIVFNSPNENNNTMWENCLYDGLFPGVTTPPKLPTSEFEAQMQPYYHKGFSATGYIVRSRNSFSMKSIDVDTQLNFVLEGQSSLWLFLRTKDKLTESSAVIKFIKEQEKSQSVSIIMGMFIDMDIGNGYSELVYKEFESTQIPETENSKRGEYAEHDKVDFNVSVHDCGLNEVVCKVLINNSGKYYQNTFKHLLPFSDSTRIFYCGIGSSCLVKNLLSYSTMKPNSSNTNENDLNNPNNKKCDCCLVF